MSKNHSSLGSLLFTTIPPKANRKPHPHPLSFKDTRLGVILIKKGSFLTRVILKKIPFFIISAPKVTVGKIGKIKARVTIFFSQANDGGLKTNQQSWLGIN